jgi:hypothetical protein
MDIACSSLSGQMNSLVRSLSTASSVKALTPAYLREWSLEKCVAAPADSLTEDVRVLAACLNTEKGLMKNKKKNSDTVRCFIFVLTQYMRLFIDFTASRLPVSWRTLPKGAW